MVRDITPFVHVIIPNWLNRKLVEKRAWARGINFKEAQNEIFEEEEKGG